MMVKVMYGGGEMARVRVAPAAQQFEALGRAMILLGALVSFVLSVSLWFTGRHEQGIFVGLWVPSILALGGLAAGRSR
jgi:hypothetical protein